MDEVTSKRMERINEKKHETDCELQYADYYWRDKLNISWNEVLMYGWTKGNSGVSLHRTKELFLRDVVDVKISTLENQ
jgi:hypothetical protein